MPTEREVEILDNYVRALGSAVFAWNNLIEVLGVLFGGVMYPGKGVPPSAFAVWHSTHSDRAQIAMLRAAAKDAKRPDNSRLDPDGRIKWLCAEANNLADARNVAVHTPMMFRTDAGEIVEITPNHLLKHPRAAQLQNKDVLNELRWLEEMACTLRDYGLAISFAVHIDKHPLPEKPKLPNRGLKKIHRDR